MDHKYEADEHFEPEQNSTSGAPFNAEAKMFELIDHVNSLSKGYKG